jgi:aspartate racemase
MIGMESDNLTARLAILSPAKRALLELQLTQNRGEPLVSPNIPRRSAPGEAPLSFAQQRLWFLNQLEPESAVYNESTTFRLSGFLDLEVLKRALDQIVLRHEVLRTVIVTVEGSPCQVIGNNRHVDLPVIDLQDGPTTDRDSEALRLIAETIRKPFDLSRDLLLRVLLLRLGEQEHMFLVVKHHIAWDGWSSEVFWRELTALYRAFTSGEPSPLPELSIQYADYAVWQREWLQGELLETQLSYWKKQLEGIGTLQLPTDRPRTSVRSKNGKCQTIELSKHLSQKLRALSRQQGATLFMTLLAAFQTLLYRYTGQEDIAVGCPIAGRTRQELEELIGFFVNTIVLRVDFSGNPTFRELLARVREVAVGAYGHQDLPFEKLVEELQPDRNLSYTPLFQVAFACQSTPTHALEIPGVLVTPVEKIVETTKFDLYLSVNSTGEIIGATLYYATDLYDDVTIARLLSHLRVLLEGIVDDPDRRLSELPILTEAEEHQLLVEWNGTAKGYPKNKCIHELFEEQVEKSPDGVAVLFDNQQLTYQELNERANQLARYLRKLGVGPEVLVGISVERSLEMVVGLLGILKAGGAYVPLDPQYPRERLAFMLEDTRAPVLLTQHRLVDGLPAHNAHVVCLDRDREQIAAENDKNPISGAAAANLACVIYTSGSTGQPKGVKVRHQGILRLLIGIDYVRLDGNQSFLQLSPTSFDASTFEIWGALLYGARCVLFPGKVPIPNELGNILHHYHVSTLWLTASLFNTVIDEAPEALSEVRQLLIGGEALSASHVQRALRLLPETQIINGYGPTESTTFTCCYSIPPRLDGNINSISIGHPIANTEVYLLDSHLSPVPIGVAGELYIGGDGLARGYLNRPELTSEKFIPHPFSHEPGARLYKTGDLARYRSDGNIDFLGRADHQVKIRGFRVELGEIEAVLRQHPAVQQTVALAREDISGERTLAAYVVPNQESLSTTHDLRNFLKQKLPQYMVPSFFVTLDALPLLPNGKVDRRALAHGRPERSVTFIAPRTAVEKLLAAIWAGVLKVEKVGIHDNFFDLGGHSLLATQVISRVHDICHLNLPLQSLFENPTIDGLARIIQTTKVGSSNSLAAAITPVSRQLYSRKMPL